MAVRIGINGFGRIGRLALRAAWGWPELEFAHVNEIAGDAVASAHLLYFDSVHGRWNRETHGEGSQLFIEGTGIGYSSIKEPRGVPWAEAGVEIVLEASGKFRTPEQLDAYFRAGVKKVLVAAPVKGGALNVVMGVNERRARASSLSLIPTTTGSATAIGLIFPELQGKLDGIAVRVPLLNASLTDCVFEVARPTSINEVNGLLQAAAAGPLKDILGFETRPLVSVDFRDDPRSAIIDAPSTMVTNGTQVKILAWYDNEWGYANRYAELARKVALSL